MESKDEQDPKEGDLKEETKVERKDKIQRKRI